MYIVLEGSIPNFDHGVNGKALARAQKVLDAIAEEEGVEPLMSFFSARPEDLLGFAEDDGVDRGKNVRLQPEQWYPAKDGLKSVTALIHGAAKKDMERASDVLADLRDFQKVLEKAKMHGIKWHLAVDF